MALYAAAGRGRRDGETETICRDRGRDLTGQADGRTRQAIERQAACMGFETPTAYLVQPIAATLGAQRSRYNSRDVERILRRSRGDDDDGLPQNV